MLHRIRLPVIVLAAIGLVTGCGNESRGTKFPLDRQKLLVSDEDYLSDEECWGGIGLQENGVWIPVEFAVDETENFTKVGISSRTCELLSIVDFEREALLVPRYYPFERHADYFSFVFSDDLKDPEGLFRSSRLLTSLSTVSVRYSDAVIFFDGHMKLGSVESLPGGGGTAFNVIEVKE
ncbi:MAG: hypothetical protein AAFQ90_12510 [Pseudomonadota bacterium]